jgi:hypothetical protein
MQETDADPSARRKFADMAAQTERLSITYRFALGSEQLDTSACPGEVESGSPTRTCANTRIYGVFRSYGITE